MILGILLFIVGGWASSICTQTGLFGFCVDHPYAAIGTLAILVGLTLVVVGIVLSVLRVEPDMPPSVAVPLIQAPPPTAGGFYPLGGTPPAPGASVAASERFCPACGTGNLRSWTYCHRCGRPLPPG